jgi:hypothetical protein
VVLYRGRGDCGGLAEGHTMTSDIDVYRSGYTLIQQHGDGAANQAVVEADDLLNKGDLDGAAVWRLIVAAVNELQREEPPAGERWH